MKSEILIHRDVVRDYAELGKGNLLNGKTLKSLILVSKNGLFMSVENPTSKSSLKLKAV